MANVRWMVMGLVLLMMASACAETDAPLADGAYSEHEESSDFDPAPSLEGKGDDVSAVFDQHNVLSDAFFLNADAMTAGQIQAFLENTPYGNRSWLADAQADGKRVSTVIAEVAQRHNLNPLMILSRFQVEGSHISKSRYPGSYSADRALGCGCFDGRSCQRSYRGIDKQIDCAADTLEKRFNGSVDGTWEWRRGRTKSTLDPIRITPRTHATAALYAYTPWVLRGRGGNWLVWNVTKKFAAHAIDLGASSSGDADVWVGSPCTTDDECGFIDGQNPGFCYDFVDAAGQTRGFCSLVCEGYCPDAAGAATTFCIAGDVAGVGICASKSEASNSYCGDMAGTTATEVDRYIGGSSASPSTATVCAPN